MIDMNHEEAFSELAAVALDVVPTEVGDAVRAHAAVCPECGPELTAMEATVVALGELVPSQQMNRGRGAGIRSRLVMRARAERETHSAGSEGPPDLSRGVASLTGLGHRITPVSQRTLVVEGGKQKTPSQPLAARPLSYESKDRSLVKWLAMAATLALVATAAQLMRVTADRNSMRADIALRDTASLDTASRNDSLTALVAERDAMIAAISGSDVKVVALTNESARQPLGRMFWNRTSNDWTMITYDLRSPRPGRTYQVWLITDDAKISAGTFKPGADGKAVMHTNYALARNALRAVAITEEPEGGVPAPTGPMVVSGTATS